MHLQNVLATVASVSILSHFVSSITLTPDHSPLANAPPTMQGTPRDNFSTIKAKAIKGLASAHEIRMLAEDSDEARPKRTCQQNVAHLHLDMEILDAECRARKKAMKQSDCSLRSEVEPPYVSILSAFAEIAARTPER